MLLVVKNHVAFDTLHASLMSQCYAIWVNFILDHVKMLKLNKILTNLLHNHSQFCRKLQLGLILFRVYSEGFLMGKAQDYCARLACDVRVPRCFDLIALQLHSSQKLDSSPSFTFVPRSAVKATIEDLHSIGLCLLPLSPFTIGESLT